MPVEMQIHLDTSTHTLTECKCMMSVSSTFLIKLQNTIIIIKHNRESFLFHSVWWIIINISRLCLHAIDGYTWWSALQLTANVLNHHMRRENSQHETALREHQMHTIFADAHFSPSWPILRTSGKDIPFHRWNTSHSITYCVEGESAVRTRHTW